MLIEVLIDRVHIVQFSEMITVQLTLDKTYLLTNVCIKKAMAENSGNLGSCDPFSHFKCRQALQ